MKRCMEGHAKRLCVGQKWEKEECLGHLSFRKPSLSWRGFRPTWRRLRAVKRSTQTSQKKRGNLWDRRLGLFESYCTKRKGHIRQGWETCGQVHWFVQDHRESWWGRLPTGSARGYASTSCISFFHAKETYTGSKCCWTREIIRVRDEPYVFWRTNPIGRMAYSEAEESWDCSSTRIMGKTKQDSCYLGGWSEV